MKNLIAAISIMATGAALASAVTSDTTFGVLKVTSTNLQTVISVPWEAVGTSGNPVKVKDFVKTSNLMPSGKRDDVELQNGDKLYKYDNSTSYYSGWFLNSTNVWEGYAIAADEITSSSYAKADEATLARGDALILVRVPTNTTSGVARSLAGSAGDIYLYGQYNETPVTTHTMAYATDESKATLFAPWNTTNEGVFVNADNATTGEIYLSWENVDASDTLALQDDNGNVVILTRHDNKWGVYNPFSEEEDEENKWYYNFKIKPGMGAWYRAAKVSTRTVAPVATRTVKAAE